MKLALTIAQIAPVLKQLVGLAEAAIPGATGEEKKAFVVELLNERFDLPFLDEAQEAALFGFGWDLLVGAVK